MVGQWVEEGERNDREMVRYKKTTLPYIPPGIHQGKFVSGRHIKIYQFLMAYVI
jgi:hypothetical protein